jgi:hypothetical protein
VFGNRSGKPLRESKLLRNVLQPAAKKAGLGRVTWHQFSHSLVAPERPQGAGQDRARAARARQYRDTLNIYTHVVDASHRKAVEAVGRMVVWRGGLFWTEVVDGRGSAGLRKC